MRKWGFPEFSSYYCDIRDGKKLFHLAPFAVPSENKLRLKGRRVQS